MPALSAMIAVLLAATPAPATMESGVASCGEAVLGNPSLGPGLFRFAEYAGWADSAVDKPNGLWDVKMGAVVKGDDPVTVRVVGRHRSRAALVYGDRRAATSIRFEPCEDHRRSTGWAGGVRLTKLRAFVVQITVQGEPPYRQRLLDEPRGLPKP